MNKIIKSVAIIAFVAAIAVGATSSYFSDEEKVSGNTITAGTIDIELNGNSSNTIPYTVADVKPGETGYMNIDVKNVGKNPVKVSKNLWGFNETTGSTSVSCNVVSGGVSSEPECEAARNNNSHEDKNDLRTKILYDLSVKVYKTADVQDPVWWQTIYTGAAGETLDSIYNAEGKYIALGTIPVGGHMMITQSYHFDKDAGNEYQGDELKFDITIKGEQLTGQNEMASVILENKTYSNGAWVINSTDTISGTLEYETNGPEFVYNFSGKAPGAGGYVLAIGLNADTNVDTKVIDVTAGTDGTIASISGSIELGKDMMGVKAWLVPAANWSGTGMNWSGGAGWPGMVEKTLWETGLVWYNDTQTP